MSGKYYPNNWQAIADAPDEVFEPCAWEDFYVWRLNGWDLPSSVMCIMRAQHKDTGEVTEHIYKNAKSASKRLINYMQDGMHDVVVCNHDSIHLIKTTEEETDDESDYDD